MPLIKTLKSDPVPQDERKLPRDGTGLVLELENTDPLARRWAARDLATSPEAAAALVSRLQREGDASVREIILSTLTCLGNEVAVAGLVQCLHNGDAALRNEAQAYAATRVRAAEGEAARFDALRVEYEKAPKVTEQRLYYEAVEDILANANEKVLMDNPAASRALPYLTLPGLGAPASPKTLEKK